MSIGAINNHDSAYTNLPASNVRSAQNQPVTANEKDELESIGLKAERENSILNGEQTKPPAMPRDEYIRGDGKTETAPGIYRREADENGNQTIAFERPDSVENGEQKNAADENAESPTSKPEAESLSPQKNDKKGGLWCTANTGRADAEIKQAKEKVQQIKQQLQRTASEEERKHLEMQLSQANAEVSAKDNDGYRKAHTTFTFSTERPVGA